MGNSADWCHGHCEWLGRAGRRSSFEVEEVQLLTEQFFVTLRAYVTKIEERQERAEAGGAPPKALERVREILARDESTLSWKDAYDIEQQLVHLYDPKTLEVELERRLVEADQSLHPDVADWYRRRLRETPDEDASRALLSRLINDLQWRYSKNEARRWYTKRITKRTELVFMASVAAFIGCTVWYVLPHADAKGLLDASRSVLIPFVGLAGAFGAAFSMMLGLRPRLAQSTFDDLKINQLWVVVAARVLVGFGAGLILLFFVKSGLLGGEAFPRFDDGCAAGLGSGSGSDSGGGLGGTHGCLSAAEFAKLFAWSFISGFSERLVPNLLASTEGRQSDGTAAHLAPMPPAAEGEPRPRGADPSQEPPGADDQTKRG